MRDVPRRIAVAPARQAYYGDYAVLLTSDELRFFKSNGYLIKRGAMDPGLMARARESLWDDPPPSLKRDDPRTWVGPLPAGDLSNDPDSIRGHFHWKYRRIGAEPWIVGMLATDPAIFAMAERMLGAGELQPPERIRGIYSILPFGDRPRPPVGCHCDGHPFHLGVVGYIDDVVPAGGGFCVWPGSHREFYHTFRTGYLRDPAEPHDAAMERVNRAPPVDCHGKAGDIVFWHHRLGHMAGHNYSSRIRQAVLFDYCKRDLDQVQDQPPSTDMWQHWSPALRAIEL